MHKLCSQIAQMALPKFKPTFWVGFLFIFQYFQQFVSGRLKIDTVSPIYEFFIKNGLDFQPFSWF
jgi:hypothetical protein